VRSPEHGSGSAGPVIQLVQSGRSGSLAVADSQAAEIPHVHNCRRRPRPLPLRCLSARKRGGPLARAIIDLLKWWLRQRDFPRFRHSLAVAGVDGTDAGELLHSPARGKLIAKDGLRVAGNALNETPFISGASYTGYMDVGNGHLDPFAVFVNNVPTPDIAQTLRDFEDVFDVSGLLWEKITGR
jgi:hypothetical protein